jgi:hypothetical protein
MLATLGVIIGVAAVVAAMAILEGHERPRGDRFRVDGLEQDLRDAGHRAPQGRLVGNFDSLETRATPTTSTKECPSVAGPCRRSPTAAS